MFGERQGWKSNLSIFIGEDGDPDLSQSPNHNRAKATAIRCHKTKLQEVANRFVVAPLILHPS